MQPGYTSCDGLEASGQLLIREVPAGALRVLYVGHGAKNVIQELQLRNQKRVIYEEEAASPRTAHAGVERGSIDCVLYDEVPGGFDEITSLLRRHRGLLGHGGDALAMFRNPQHHAVLAGLMRGGFGGPTRQSLPSISYAAALKLFLDEGYAPTPAGLAPAPCPDELFHALRPALRALGLPADRARRLLDASHFLVRARPLRDPGFVADEPITFAACVSDEAVLADNLLASPDLAAGAPHDVLLFRGCRSAAEGLNAGLAAARHRWVVCLHQDVYLPRGWVARFLAQMRLADKLHGPVGIAGVYGVSLNAGRVERAGHVLDRDRLLHEASPLPAAVEALDELLLAVPRGSPLRFDERLGFHFYGVDICLQAATLGLRAAALDALCFHNSRSVDLPAEFYPSGACFAAKWAQRLPVATPCVLVRPGGRMEIR